MPFPFSFWKVPFDPAAQAYFTAAGITDTTEKNAWNDFVVGTKADGTWSKLVKVWPISPTSHTAARRCAKTLVQLTNGGQVPTHSAAGWDFDGGGAQYMATTEDWSDLPALGLTSTVWSMGIYVNSIPGLPLDDRFFMGIVENSDAGSPAHAAFAQCAIGISTSGFLGYPGNPPGSTRLGPAGGTSPGFISVSSNVEGDQWLYVDGSGAESNNLGTGDDANHIVYFGAANGIFFDPEFMEDLGSVYRPVAFRMSFASIASGFTEAETASFRTRVQAYQTALGRNV